MKKELEFLLKLYNTKFDNLKPIKKIKMSSAFCNLIENSFALYEDNNCKNKIEFMGIPVEIDDSIINWKIEE